MVKLSCVDHVIDIQLKFHEVSSNFMLLTKTKKNKQKKMVLLNTAHYKESNEKRKSNLCMYVLTTVRRSRVYKISHIARLIHLSICTQSLNLD